MLLRINNKRSILNRVSLSITYNSLIQTEISQKRKRFFNPVFFSNKFKDLQKESNFFFPLNYLLDKKSLTRPSCLSLFDVNLFAQDI